MTSNKKVHPFMIDFMNRRGMQKEMQSLQDDQVIMLFDGQHRVKIKTMSMERLIISASVKQIPIKKNEKYNLINKGLFLSYAQFFSNGITLYVDTDLGILMAAREILHPQRSSEIEQALEDFVNEIIHLKDVIKLS